MADGFVGVLHSVVRSRLPTVPIVDLGHDVPPGDVRAGGLALARVAPYLAPGVVVAVVDPGVGTRRRAVAVEAADAAIIFVAPDNGLVLPAVDRLGGPRRAAELKVRFTTNRASGPTFDGRDVFAPAAALLAGGHDLADVGPEVPASTLARLAPPYCAARPDGWLEAEVTWVDRFGNTQLAATPADVGATFPTFEAGAAWDDRATVELVVRPSEGPAAAHGTTGTTGTPAGARPARVVRTFADLGSGELGILVDSDGHLALCLNGASAATHLAVKETDHVLVRPLRD